MTTICTTRTESPILQFTLLPHYRHKHYDHPIGCIVSAEVTWLNEGVVSFFFVCLTDLRPCDHRRQHERFS